MGGVDLLFHNPEVLIAIISSLTITLTLTPLGLSNVGLIFAQDENLLGQYEEDDNDVFQSGIKSQKTSQDSECNSGESTSISCNNFSSEMIGSSIQGEQGPTGL